MSALSQEWAPGAVSPGARPFANEIEDLKLAGIEFAPEQLDLLERGSLARPGSWWEQSVSALLIKPMYDPLVPHSEKFMTPCLAADEQGNLDPVLVPAVVDIDCTEWERFDAFDLGWRRFPSLLGRMHMYDVFEDHILEPVQPFRLWNLWPISVEDAALVQDAQERWIKTEWQPYLDWISVRDNDDDTACDFEGTPVWLHDHQYDEHGRLRACVNGDAWFDHYRQTELTYDPKGFPRHRPFAPVGGLHHLTPVWERLLASSRSNSLAAMLAYPEWDRQEVARTERHYSPWLWSS